MDVNGDCEGSRLLGMMGRVEVGLMACEVVGRGMDVMGLYGMEFGFVVKGLSEAGRELKNGPAGSGPFKNPSCTFGSIWSILPLCWEVSRSCQRG